jgi:hypothetical protein
MAYFFNDPKIMNCIKQWTTIFIPFFIVIIIAFYAIYDPSALNNPFFQYLLMITIPFLFGFVVLLLIFRSRQKDSPTTLFFAGVVVLGIIGIVSLYTTFRTVFLKGINDTYILTILKILIVVFGLAFFVSIWNSRLKLFMVQNQGTWGSFFVNMLFFVPCMISDFFHYLAEQLRITPRATFVLFFIELVLILTYIFIPKLMNRIASENAVFLLPDAVFLNKKKVISNSNPMILDNVDKRPLTVSDRPTNFRENYAFTMWIYVNDYDKSKFQNQTKNIFNYGGGKPKIEFTQNQHVFTFSNRNAEKTVFKTKLKPQKWNFIAINYNYNQADLFVNGILVHTTQFKNSVPTYQLNDVVFVGDANGMDGAVCNVAYHSYPLTRKNIVNEYNLLKMNNPPVYPAYQQQKLKTLGPLEEEVVQDIQSITNNMISYQWFNA